MSRGKIRASSEICADCNAQDPAWASINRGVLICDECCSIHRSLGRHISQIKSLKKGSWSPTQLAMLHQLVSFRANDIWEHTLLEPTQNKQGRRKPNPRDQIHPTKADFIRAKYQFLAFNKRPANGEVSSVEDLSKQLYSCVRTSNLETSLRLLSLGADANYINMERGSTPLHIAAQAGQTAQVELLGVYGADPGAMDVFSKTPADLARAEGHTDLADRLVECQYELTDRLAYYLCERKPDHRTGQHFIIPEMADSSLDLSELAKQAKIKLQALPNNLFEELACDVYDEVDRRETEQIWLSTQTQHSTAMTERQTVPFLPVNPSFSATRNQGRQKLARFNAREFATLVIDILSDARRRQCGITSPVHIVEQESSESKKPVEKKRPNSQRVVKTSSLSDDEPLYDTVASDEDYSSIDNPDLKEEALAETEEESKRPESATSDHSDGPITLEEYLHTKRQLAESEMRLKQLSHKDKSNKQKIDLLNDMVQKLMQENAELRSGKFPETIPNGHEATDATGQVQLRAHRVAARPASMFEPRMQKNTSQSKQKTAVTLNTVQQRLVEDHEVPYECTDVTTDTQASSGDSDYDNANKEPSPGPSEISETAEASSVASGVEPTTAPSGEQTSEDEKQDNLPSQEEVVKKTDRITKKIQELLHSAQEGKDESYIPSSERIELAVKDMAFIFPEEIKSNKIEHALHLLVTSASKLKEEVQKLPADLDRRLKTQQVIQCAYDIAKAAKNLVQLFQ
ncbi:unnamed protein product [Owenia fusiformis]|uniref:Uncharacterized protein n=1 Tax=Owenia fusiformis TaxID=6347 RepID=A0A8J1TK29_OWEFU|nr:unnamed protein product [Owenia fusiformis]